MHSEIYFKFRDHLHFWTFHTHRHTSVWHHTSIAIIPTRTTHHVFPTVHRAYNRAFHSISIKRASFCWHTSIWHHTSHAIIPTRTTHHVLPTFDRFWIRTSRLGRYQIGKGDQGQKYLH